MKDTNDYLPSTLEIIDRDIELIKDQEWARADSGKNEAQNYLLFLRDEVNKRLKAERKA